ncbi:hypothetical protein DMN91_006502 [Ooceraea biroi]|uniref:17-beta-hydroxysteroid dehydrogenase n=1 Tax=Ooceraea biroi TaxID=2015173 RepID=A0A026WGU2_OOCBI|nr:17-beta-hydroxysteroid dehydrogenase 13 [Ooceraea biroi]EZA54299.1 17-beta-hydroxysteroid dehydrogenase [Ooceraea biroi]RLU22122.1 hypothetical protein DMN91_006502 [Ooceraea biroi]
MMLPIQDVTIASTRTNSTNNLWLYLSIEFLIAAAISGFLAVLNVIKSFLPKPPRDLTGNVVLIAGASSTLGESLVEEFIKSGCSVICVDKNIRSAKEITARLRSRCHMEGIGLEYRKSQPENAVGSIIAAYECDLLNRDAIREIVKKVEDKVNGIDILVTCTGQPNQDIFNTINTTLMSHYWTMLSFLPFMLRRDKAHIVGITPILSTEDAFMGSKAAIASLMESLSQELSNRNTHLTFLTISPTAEQGSTVQNKQQMAKDIVQAVSRDQCSISISWSSEVLYRISCVIYSAITRFTQWLHT